MPKVIVDKQLADTLKTMRQERNMPARQLAEEWGKSPSYISKLENGIIKTIDQDDLVQCLRIIVGNAADDSYIDELFKTVSYKFSPKELEELLWLYNFESVYRRIPVSEEIVEEINKLLSDNNIALEQLLDRINGNEFLPEALKTDDNCPLNVWIRYKDDADEGTFIKMSISIDSIRSLLDRKRRTSNYITLQAIVLYLYRIIDYPNVELLTEQQKNVLNGKVLKFLENHKIYTLAKKKRLVEEAENDEQINEKLSKYDGENRHIINEVIESLVFYSDYDVVSANEEISSFTENLLWDSPFIMQIAGMPFYQLKNCSFRVKKQMLAKIQGVFEEFMEMPEKERRMEEYK